MIAGAPAEGRPSRWEYVDPKGNTQGPFPASDLLKWSNGGFFSADQKVGNVLDSRCLFGAAETDLR